MGYGQSYWKQIVEVLQKGLDFQSAWERPEAEKVAEMRDVSAMLLVAPAVLLMHQFTTADSRGQKLFFLALAYTLCLAAVIIFSKERRFMLWAVYLPQLASSLLILSLDPGLLPNQGSDVPAYGGLVLSAIGATIAVARRRELRFVHLGLTLCPLALVPW